MLAPVVQGLPLVWSGCPALTLLPLERPPKERLAGPQLVDRQQGAPLLASCEGWAGPGCQDTAVVEAPGSRPGLLDGAPSSHTRSDGLGMFSPPTAAEKEAVDTAARLGRDLWGLPGPLV